MDRDTVSPVEHWQVMADIARLKIDAKDLHHRVDDLEKKAWQNDVDHEAFKVSASSILSIQETLRKIEKATIVIDKKQAADSGMSFFGQIMRNPQHLMWVILGIVAITMILMGYSYAEIVQIIDRMK